MDKPSQEELDAFVQRYLVSKGIEHRLDRRVRTLLSAVIVILVAHFEYLISNCADGQTATRAMLILYPVVLGVGGIVALLVRGRSGSRTP